MRVNLLCPKLGLPGRFHMAFVSTLPLSVNWSVLLLELIYGSEVQYSWDRKSTWDKRACQRWWVCQRVYPKCGRRALRMLNMVITWHGTAGEEPSPYVFKRKTIWSNVSAVALCADLKASLISPQRTPPEQIPLWWLLVLVSRHLTIYHTIHHCLGLKTDVR